MSANPSATAPQPAALRTLALQAAVALAGSDEPTRLAALLGWPAHALRAAWPAEGLPAADARDPLSVVAAWFAQEPGEAASAVARAIALHLQQGRVELAAPIALGFGTAVQRLGLLREAGWSLLWRPARAALGQLLDSVAMEPEADAAPVLALRLAWWIEVERVPHVADRRLQQGSALSAAEQAMFRARIAQIFDDARGALALAHEAVAGFANDLQPQALMAKYALGFALLDAGRPRDALVPLADVVRAAARDELPLLALDVLAVQARAYEELDDPVALDAVLNAARGLAAAVPQQSLALVPVLHSLQRLQRLRQLRCPFSDAEPLPALAPDPAPEAYEAFPSLVIDALALQLQGAHDRAGEQLDALAQRLALAFHCAKWRNSHLQARLWWLARRPDGSALQALLAPPRVPVEDATLVELHQAVLAAAAAVLAGRPWPAAMLQGLHDGLAARGLAALLRRLLLLRGIGPPVDAEALLDWLAQGVADGQLLDALWLAPKLAAALEALLGSVAIVRHPAERQLAQRLYQHMQAAPAVPEAASPAVPQAAPPPADLTQREWEILQLIGQHFTNEQIAAQLNVSIATVKTHINRVYGKLAIGSRAEAVQRAHHLG